MNKVPILHYSDHGNGSVVVLLHGYMASSRYWQVFAAQLAQKHRVIAIDLLGFGKSPKPFCSKYDYDAQAASIEATLKAADVRGRYTLVGHSMGALLSLHVARLNQHRIKKLILSNMPVLLNTDDARTEILGTNLMYRIGLHPGLHSLVWPLFKIATRLRLLPSRIAEGAVNRRSYMFQSTGAARLRSMRNVIFAAKIQADLEALHITTVLINGLSDRKRYLDNMTRLKIRQNIQAFTVPTGHHTPLTHPALLADHI